MVLGSMVKEYPGWNVRVLDMEAGQTWPLDDMFTIVADGQAVVWAYRGGLWHRQQ